MSQDFVSSLPGIYEALLGLIEEAAAGRANPQVTVFPFEPGQYEPGAYIVITRVGPVRYDWMEIGTFAQEEIYPVEGRVSLFTGDSQATTQGVATQMLVDTFAIFNACVNTPVFSNRNMPILGTTGTSPFLMLPGEVEFEAGVGLIDGGPGGWQTKLDFSLEFRARIQPE